MPTQNYCNLIDILTYAIVNFLHKTYQIQYTDTDTDTDTDTEVYSDTTDCIFKLLCTKHWYYNTCVLVQVFHKYLHN